MRGWLVPSSVVRREVDRLVKEGFIPSTVAHNLLGSVMQYEEFIDVPTENDIESRSDILRRRTLGSRNSVSGFLDADGSNQ
jgi:hypothetical protein